MDRREIEDVESHRPDPGKARDDVVERWAVAGPPEQIAARLQEYIDRGVRIFQLVIGSPDQFGQMRLIAEQVLPLIRRPPGAVA